jgi:tetratricopeptide (TPR) repeat protein
LYAEAVRYWQQAGQHTNQHSAHVEMIAHLSKALPVLQLLPENPERGEQELRLHLGLGSAWITSKGYAAPEVGYEFTRANEPSAKVDNTTLRFSVFSGLYVFYEARGQYHVVRRLAERYLPLAERLNEAYALRPVHTALGHVTLWMAELSTAQEHLEQAIALYDLQKNTPFASFVWHDAIVLSLGCLALTLWLRGYADQAQEKMDKAVALDQELAHSHTLVFALDFSALLQNSPRNGTEACTMAETGLTIAIEQGFSFWVGPVTLQ